MCNCPEPIECEVCGSMERVIEYQGCRVCENCVDAGMKIGGTI